MVITRAKHLIKNLYKSLPDSRFSDASINSILNSILYQITTRDAIRKLEAKISDNLENGKILTLDQKIEILERFEQTTLNRPEEKIKIKIPEFEILTRDQAHLNELFVSSNRRISNSPTQRLRSTSRENLNRQRSSSRDKMFHNNRKVSFEKLNDSLEYNTPKSFKKEIYPYQRSASAENISSKIENLTKCFKDFSSSQNQKINNIESEIMNLKSRNTLHTQLRNFDDARHVPALQRHRRQNSVHNFKHFIPTITLPDGEDKHVGISLEPKTNENLTWRGSKISDKNKLKKPKCNFCNSDIPHDFKLCKKIQYQKNLKVPQQGRI